MDDDTPDEKIERLAEEMAHWQDAALVAHHGTRALIDAQAARIEWLETRLSMMEVQEAARSASMWGRLFN